MLEQYERLLYNQNKQAFIRLQAGGATMLKPHDRKELNELIRIKRQKNGLIERLRRQKEETKYKQLEERVKDEVQRGIRRAQQGRYL